MDIDRRAKAYADHFYPIFIGRYITAAQLGRSDIIPAEIRANIVGFVRNEPAHPRIDPQALVWMALYNHRLQTGGDLPLPPDVQPTTGQAALQGAKKGAMIGLRVAASLLRRGR